jgi:hypothetical protein
MIVVGAKAPVDSSLLVSDFTHYVYSEIRVRDGSTCTHLNSDPDGFHHLFSCCSSGQRPCGMPTNAVRALRDMRHRNRDELLDLDVECAISEHTLLNVTNASFVSGASACRSCFSAGLVAG